MYLTAQGYYIPKAGGTFGIQLLSELGAPVSLTSVTFTDSTINSSVVIDQTHLMFTATYPANTTNSIKTYSATARYSVNGRSYSSNLSIEQTGTSSYLYSDPFYKPFVNSARLDFHSSFSTSSLITEPLLTAFEYDQQYSAPHYRTVSDYFDDAHSGNITAGDWVYVDGKINTSYYGSYNSNGYLYNVRWIDADANSGSSVTPHIEFDKLYSTNYNKFTSNPTTSTKDTYKTIGFQHKSITSSATSVNITTSAFIQATQGTYWATNTGWDGTTVTRPFVQSYDVPMTNVTYYSDGGDLYHMNRSWGDSDRVRYRIMTIYDSSEDYCAEGVFLQVPPNSVNISNTTPSIGRAAGAKTFSLGTFTNFDYRSDLFSISFPDGQPAWITAATVSNPSGSNLQANVTATENTTGAVRTATARVNWLDKYTDITITQSNDVPGSIVAAHNPALIQGSTGYYWDVLTLTNINTSTLSVSNTLTNYFNTYIDDRSGEKVVYIQTLNSNVCQSGNITDTVVITATDLSGDPVSLSIPITQSTLTADYNFTPSGSYTLDPTGGDVDFEFEGDSCVNANPEYHLTGIDRVYYYAGNNVYVDLAYTTSFVDGKLNCKVTFPANTGSAAISGDLYFTVATEFLPGGIQQTTSRFRFTQDVVPSGSITFTTTSPLWYPASPTTSSETNTVVSAYAYFTATNVDTSTITCSGYNTSIVNEVRFNSAYNRATIYVNPNGYNVSRSTTVTISGTDLRGNTVSDTITVSQVGAAETIKFYITSPSGTSSSNPALITNNTLTVLFTAQNVNNFSMGGTMSSYITNTSITNVSGNNYQAVLTFSDNGGSVRNGTLYVNGNNTVVGSPLASSWSTPSIRVRQAVADGTLSTDLNAIVVPASSSYEHRDVRVISSNINGSITPSISGDVSGTFSWYTYNNNSYLLFTPADNTTQNTLTGTITLTATDYNGNTLTTSYSVTQKAYYPFLNFLNTSLGYYRILSDESRRDISIACQGVSITNVQISEESSVSAFGTYVTSTSFTQVDSDHYTYTVNTRDNNSHQQSNIAFLHPVGLTTEFGKNPWVTDYTISGAWQSPTIFKCGIAGVLRLSPSSDTVDGTAGSTSFTIYRDSYLTGSVSADHSGSMDITNLSISSNNLNVTYGANNGVIDKIETLTISGRDYQGLTVTSSATLRQRVISNLSFIDTNKAIAQDATSVEFRISDSNVTNLQVSTSGSVVVTNNTLTTTTGGHLLTLTVAVNNTRVTRSSTITVSASDPYGNTISSTARLTQASLDGLLTIDPTTKTVPKTGSTFVILVSTDGIDTSTISATTSGGINFDGLIWNSGRTQLTVGYNTNTGSTDLTGTVTISGTDYNGHTQTATCNVTQVTADSSLSITPNQQTVDTTVTTTATFTINHTYVTLGNVSFSGATSYINTYNLQGDTLTLNLRQVTTASEQIAYVTMSGYDLGGSEITATATLKIWGIDGYFSITPASGWDVSKDSGQVHYYESSYGIRSNSITRVVDQTWASVSNSGYINYAAYSGVPTTWDAHRDCVLTISGVDYKGNVVTETRTLRQYALDAEMTIYPTTADIEYNGYVDVDVTLVGPAPVPGITQSGTVTWLNQWGTGTTRTNTVRITPPTNLTYSAKTLSYTFQSTPLYTSGSTIWRYLTINQGAKPATIVLTPAASTVNKDAGSIVYDITVDGVTQSSLQRSYSGSMISSATFNSDKTQLTVVYTANTLVANRTATIYVYSDYLSSRVTGQATITQTGVDPILTAYDLAIGYHQASATNLITTKGVGNLTVSFSGNVTISDYYFTATSGGQNLTIETPNNDTTTTYTSVATVTGTVTEGQYEGETRTATFNIYKYGIESVTLTPASRTLDYGENTTTYTVTAVNVSNLQVSVTGDSSFITNRSLSNGVLTITTTDFAAKTAKNATITVSGTGFTGTISGSATLTKYGPDGTIDVSTNSLNFPRSAYSKTVTVTASGITGSVVPTYSGTISPSNISLNGSTLTIALNANTTANDLTGTITLTGTDYKGNTITETISVVQKPYDSLIQLDPSSRTVDKNAGSTTYTLTTDSVDASTIRVSYSGASITNATRSGNTITVTYRENTVVATRANTITVTATDDYGTSISTTADLAQTGIDPTMSVNNVNILSTQANATVFVSTNGIGLPASVSFSGNVNVTDYTTSSTSGGFNINIVTADNLTSSPLTSTATVTATVTEGQYAGETRSATFTVTKFGIEGVVTIDPTAVTVRKAGQNVVFDVTLGNMQNNTVTASVGTFNSDKSQLTVNVGQNTSSTDRTINVTVSGTDNNGSTKSATAVITQYGIDPYLTISPASKVVRSDTSLVTYTVSAYKVSDISVNIDGYINVLDYTLSGSTLSITTADNTDQFQQMSTITVSGTDELGASLTATATLIKAGVGGGIIVNGEYIIPSNAGKLAIDYILEEMDEDTIVATSSGDINITELYVNRDDKVIVVSYGANSSSENKTGRIFLTGTGEDGLPKVVTIELTQLGTGYSITINPSEYDVTYSSGTKSFTVTTNGISSTSFDYSGSMDTSSCTYSSGTINVAYNANNTTSVKYLYLTVTGVATNGSTVTSSAVLRQGIDGSYTFQLSPAGQTPKTIEASATNLRYTFISNRGTVEVGYSVTGFILTGRWGTRPSVVIGSDGYPIIKIPLNTHSETRSVRIIFTQDGSNYSVNAVVNQEAGVEPNVTPIWKEFTNSVSTETFIEYHINLDGDIIYAGKAYKYPDEAKVTWSINDAVSNYLGNGISFTEGIQQIPEYSKDFYMEDNLGDKFIETFYNSWAYKNTDYWLSDPIDNRVDPRQWLPVSFLSTNYEFITVAGRTYAALKENDGWTVMTRLRNLVLDCDSGVVAVGEDTSRLNYKIAQGEYVLYYSNAFGGWDAILCNGTSKKTDNIEHMNYRKKSRSQSQFSKVNYQNNITPTWTLNTGITVDGSKMHHLLESTMVYLHILETDEIIPVVITNSQCEYLNYTNNAKKPYFYNITVEESNTKLRK